MLQDFPTRRYGQSQVCQTKPNPPVDSPSNQTSTPSARAQCSSINTPRMSGAVRIPSTIGSSSMFLPRFAPSKSRSLRLSSKPAANTSLIPFFFWPSSKTKVLSTPEQWEEQVKSDSCKSLRPQHVGFAKKAKSSGAEKKPYLILDLISKLERPIWPISKTISGQKPDCICRLTIWERLTSEMPYRGTLSRRNTRRESFFTTEISLKQRGARAPRVPRSTVRSKQELRAHELEADDFFGSLSIRSPKS